MKHGFLDWKSFLIGALSVALLMVLMGAGEGLGGFSAQEVALLKDFAGCIQTDGNLNLGKRKIIMQASSIYDDSSEGGGLILRGGANQVHVHGDTSLDGNLTSNRDTVGLGFNVNLGKRKIIMQDSSIYDDSSEGGGLILRGGANQVHVHGDTSLDGNLASTRDTISLRANLNMERNRIILQGSSIYDDSSEGGGLILRGGAGRIHFFGQTLPH